MYSYLTQCSTAFLCSLFFLVGCSLGVRSEQTPPPTAVASPAPTIIATNTAVVSLAEPETPTATPEPVPATATNVPRPAATAVPPSHTPLPAATLLPTLTAEQRQELLLPSLIFQAVDNDSGYRHQQVSWEPGFRRADYCEYGPYRWLDNDHLLLYPIVGQTDWFDGAVTGEVTWPVVANLAGEIPWGVAMPLTDRCEQPVWSSRRQQIIEVEDEIRLRDLQGAVVATYAGEGPLHLAPTGQRLLAGNQWLDLERGITTTTGADWKRLSFARPAWTADETALFGCCFAYTDAVSGDGWSRQGFPGLYITGVGVGPGFFGTPAHWLAEDTAVLVQPLHINFWEEESQQALVPLLDPVAETYVDLITALDLNEAVHNCAPYASPPGTHLFLTCRELTEDLMDRPHPLSYLVTLPSLTAVPVTGTITFQGWSADGRFLAYTEWDDETGENGRVWLLNSSGERRQLSEEPASWVWWHPTEPRLALRLFDHHRLRLIQVETGQERGLEMVDAILTLVWQPNGEGLALLTNDNLIWWLARPLPPRPDRLPTLPIPLTPPDRGAMLHSLRWSPDGTRLAYLHDNHLSVITVDSGPQTVYSEMLDFAIELPPRWVMVEVEGMPLFASDERFGDWPTPMQYFVYAQEYPNPEQRPFAELVTADLGDNIQAEFSYTSETIGPYTVHRSEQMPSMSGALTLFFELPGRYLALALAPYDSELPYPAQADYLALFEAMLFSVSSGRPP